MLPLVWSAVGVKNVQTVRMHKHTMCRPKRPSYYHMIYCPNQVRNINKKIKSSSHSLLLRVAAGGAHLRGLAPRATQKRHSSGEPLATKSDLTVPRIESKTCRTDVLKQASLKPATSHINYVVLTFGCS